MKQLTPEVKHSILSHYTSPNNRDTLSSILSLHDIRASRQSVNNWKNQWDGTIESLKHKSVSGRPHILDQRELTRYVETPIREANQSSVPIRYTSIANSIRQKLNKNISDRTIQRYGKEELGGKMGRGKKRSADECKYKYDTYPSEMFLFVWYYTD